MNTQIDLSKAHKGQIVTFKDGRTDKISFIKSNPFTFYIEWDSSLSPFGDTYYIDGVIDLKYANPKDIVKIEDAPEMKVIKYKAQVDALEYALKYVSNPFERGKLCARIDELKAEILILTVETYEGNN